MNSLQDVTPVDRKERDFLSSDEEEEIVQGDQISRFFSPKDYHSLLYKCLTAVDLKGPPQGAEAPKTDTDPKNKLWCSGDFFPQKVLRHLRRFFHFISFLRDSSRGNGTSQQQSTVPTACQ